MKILFCGPYSNRVGGGESGNRKTVELLKKYEFDVDILSKPYPRKDLIFFSLLYAFQLVKYLLTYIYMLSTDKEIDAVHITGFYSHLIYLELIFVLLGRVCNKKIVYELRAGGAIKYYKSGSVLYRWSFIKTLSLSNLVLSQGKIYLKFWKDELSDKGVYYPNFIHESYLYTRRNDNISIGSEFNILYLGRIVPEKNLEFTFKIFNKLLLDGLKPNLHLIGSYDKSYREFLKNIIDNGKDVSQRVKFMGVLSQDEIHDKCKDFHFFIFPTKEKREGHSNSLTEAMASGLVPIASDHGFNMDVINSDYLVKSIYSINDYAMTIVEILDEGTWQYYSNEMIERVRCNYTDAIVSNSLYMAYDKLIMELCDA